MQVGISRQNGGQVHLERATTQCSGRTEYRGLETSGRRLLGTSALSGLNPNFVDAMCTVQMGEQCSLWLKAHCVY